MKKNQKNWKIRVLSVGAALLCLCGGVLAAGDEKDPLISLSYLTKTAMPDILDQVDEAAEKYQKNLLKEFNKAIDQYKGEMKQEQKEDAKSATYEAAVLAQGERLELSTGSEVLLRVGSAAVSSIETTALVDMSGGNTLSDGESLESNHLYVAAVSGCAVTADSAEVTVLVRGEYQIF